MELSYKKIKELKANAPKKTRAGRIRNKWCDKELWHFAPFPEEYDREQLIQYIELTNLVEWLTTKLMHKYIYEPYVQDYIQECWVQILNVKDKTYEKLHAQGYPAVTAFVSKIIRNTVKSNTSLAYKTLKKNNLKTIHVDDDVWEEIYEDKYPEIITEMLNEIDFKERFDVWKKIEMNEYEQEDTED